jgi:hypothetical protein
MHNDSHTSHDHDSDDHIHMPPPSLSPIVLAFGISFFVFALANTVIWLRLTLLVLGLLLMGYGLYTWIYDDVKAAAATEEGAEAH